MTTKALTTPSTWLITLKDEEVLTLEELIIVIKDLFPQAISHKEYEPIPLTVQLKLSYCMKKENFLRKFMDRMIYDLVDVVYDSSILHKAEKKALVDINAKLRKRKDTVNYDYSVLKKAKKLDIDE